MPSRRNLTSLFSTTPEQLKAKIAGKAIVKKGLKIAGAQPAHDLDLDRMQVSPNDGTSREMLMFFVL
jgi:hypothetical protein